MAFVTRQDVLENSFCKHDATQNTPRNPLSPTVCPAGAIVTISNCDGETAVVKWMDSGSQVPFGFLMQEVRTQYVREYVPAQGMMERDKGTMREFVGGPVGVAHHGVYSTNVYDQDVQITAGDLLYATASGTLCNSSGAGYVGSGYNHNNPVAIAMNTLTMARMNQNRYLHIKALI